MYAAEEKKLLTEGLQHPFFDHTHVLLIRKCFSMYRECFYIRD